MSSRPSEASGPVRGRALVRRLAVGSAMLGLAAGLAVGPASSPAAADPPLTIAEAKAQVEQLETDAAALDEDATAVKVKLAAGTKQLTLKRADVRQQTARVARIRKQAGLVALAQFQNRNLDPAAQLFLTSDTDGFLSKMSTVEKVSENQNAVLQDYQASQARLADLERAAQVDVATLRTQDRQLAALRAASAAKITQSTAVLARLTEEERRRIAAEEAAVEAAAKKAAEKAEAEARAEATAKAKAEATAARRHDAGSTTASKSSRDDSGSDPSGELADQATSESSSRRAARAVGFARRQLGKPYVWGATGPGSFDCSGLTSSAWRSAGVGIPRTSRDQSVGAGRPVARSELRPGDLVFFYSPVKHVAIYVGNGIVIHAPRPGKSVTYTKMSRMPYAGARRPG